MTPPAEVPDESRDGYGEVAIRRNGQEHAVDAPELDGQVYVDLDGRQDGTPLATLPPEFRVEYHDQEDVVTDGGVATGRTEVTMRGYGLSEGKAAWSMVLGVILLVGSGAMLFGTPMHGAAGLAMLAGGGLTAYIGARSFWGSGRTA